ncbi:MAG: sigma-70 family RNA polymerase sigma factor [Planctomycetota bacterium]
MSKRRAKPTDEPTDEELLGRYRAGETDLFPTLVGRYRQELLHFLIRFAGNRAAAEDLFQEAFLQVHLSADTFDVSKRFKPWLFTIAANKARDYLRRASRRKAASLSAPMDKGDDSAGSFVDLLQADLPLPETIADEQETRDRVRAVVDAMPSHLREILLLAYFQQMAYKEVAEALGIPLGTVKSRLHAAVGTFADLWKSAYPETAPPQEPA